MLEIVKVVSTLMLDCLMILAISFLSKDNMILLEFQPILIKLII